ncbi:MAG: hypothetical protein KIT84_10100 [Labilithrix sp.]|nr:hypothetical protein [Labilithrix sp.]MCW5811355.1 hypothetical protein [Labilithrix sp.]
MNVVARARDVAFACVLVAGATFACNQIVGVTEVKLKRDRNDAGEVVGDDDDDDNTTPPPPVDGATQENKLTVVLGEAHTCARKTDGTVKCWGDDSQGQTGTLGAAADATTSVVATPAAVTSITDARAIAAGRVHTCVAHVSGKLSCWGYNLDGQLGNGKSGDRSPAPVEVAGGITNAFAVAAGGNFSCALRGAGSVVCWGGNGSGQLGSGDTSPSLTPRAVAGLSGIERISAGQAHVCVVRGEDGKVLCWGEGGNGQLGNGKTQGSFEPVEVASLPKAVAVSAGERSTCALTETGSVLCWGANEVGQLGSGAANTNPNPSPISVADLRDAVAIASGRNHTCAVRTGGQVVCWGEGKAGQLGDDVQRDAGTAVPRSVPVARLADGFRIGAGAEHTCATTTSDAITCWGAGDRGQLGNGQAVGTRAPVAVTGL